MPKENVEIVRNAYDAFNAFMRGERSEEALAALVDPEFEYHWPGERELPEPDHSRGGPEIFAFLKRVQSAWIDFVWEPLEFIEAPGNRVLTTVRQSAGDERPTWQTNPSSFRSSRSEMDECANWSSSAVATGPSKPPLGCGTRPVNHERRLGACRRSR